MKKPFYGWWIVSVGVLGNCLQGGFIFWTMGLYTATFEDHFGAPRAQINLIETFLSVGTNLLSPVAGVLIDRWSPRHLMAIGIAARQPGLKTVGVKSLDQQSVQSDKRVQEHLSDQLTATGNLLRALVAEFGVVIPKGIAALRRRMPEILEDAENGLPLAMRESLSLAWQQWLELAERLRSAQLIIRQRAQQQEPCVRLQQLLGSASEFLSR